MEDCVKYFDDNQLQDLYYHFHCKRVRIIDKDMPSFTIHCTPDDVSLSYCAQLAKDLKRKIFFAFDYFDHYTVTFYDNNNTEPKIDLFDLLQEYYNKPDFWNKFNINEKYNFLVVNKNYTVVAYIYRPTFYNDKWFHVNEEDMIDEPFRLSKEESKIIIDYMEDFDNSLKIIKRP